MFLKKIIGTVVYSLFFLSFISLFFSVFFFLSLWILVFFLYSFISLCIFSSKLLFLFSETMFMLKLKQSWKQYGMLLKKMILKLLWYQQSQSKFFGFYTLSFECFYCTSTSSTHCCNIFLTFENYRFTRFYQAVFRVVMLNQSRKNLEKSI